jgi:F0F1-type ATP synthase assembly protein I
MNTVIIDFLKEVKNSSTPRLLRLSLLATWGASLLLITTAVIAAQSQREAIKAVGLDAVPSILNAQRIRDSLADLDANAANELLVKPGQNPDAITAYNQRREKIAKLLVAVAENITYDDQERIPIQTIQAKLGDYIQLIQQARDFNSQGNEASKLQAYRIAAELIDKELLPAAITLADVNNKQLTKSYQEQRFSTASSLSMMLLCGLLVLGILIGVQIFLNNRMRRILNPGLLAASVVTIVFLGYAIQTLGAAADHLKVAKEDAFDSLFALRVSRALAYSANGDESRYLLDKSLASKHEQAFLQKTSKIAEIPATHTFASIANAYQTTEDKDFKVPGFKGFMADDLHNITFTGERIASVETLRFFGFYVDIDKKIRQLEQSGKHPEAIALCIGNKTDQSNWAFDRYKDAQQKVININMEAFQKSIVQAFNEVGIDTDFKIKVNPISQDAQVKKKNESIEVFGTTNKVETRTITRFEVIAALAVIIISLLTLWGLSPRLKEYTG